MRSPFLAVVLLAMPAAAGAHIGFADPHAAAGGYYVGFLNVTHGCGDAATLAIRVTIPEGINVARPQPKAGWTISVEHGPLAQPLRNESGGSTRQRVTAISWTGRLPADQFDQFGLMMRLPATAGVLFFPTTQRCTTGANAWINRPATPEAWHATAMPAPMLIVGAPAAPMAAMDHEGRQRQ